MPVVKATGRYHMPAMPGDKPQELIRVEIDRYSARKGRFVTEKVWVRK